MSIEQGTSPTNDLNRVMREVSLDGRVTKEQATEILAAHEAHKSGMLRYTEANLRSFRAALGIETNERFFGSPDLLILKRIVGSRVDDILDGSGIKRTKSEISNKAPDVKQGLTLRGRGDWSDIELSSRDITNFARMLKAEAGGESTEGKEAVATVILNRMQSPLFPKSLSGVLFQPGQFSPISDGRFAATSADASHIDVIADLLRGGENPLENALFFQINRIRNGWINRTQAPIITIGGHTFFGPKDIVLGQTKLKTSAA